MFSENWFIKYTDQRDRVFLYQEICPCAPEAVSVAVWSVWLWAALCPECPGLGRCPVRSSYTVYTKQCMYKIEKSEKHTKKIV